MDPEVISCVVGDEGEIRSGTGCFRPVFLIGFSGGIFFAGLIGGTGSLIWGGAGSDLAPDRERVRVRSVFDLGRDSTRPRSGPVPSPPRGCGSSRFPGRGFSRGIFRGNFLRRFSWRDGYGAGRFAPGSDKAFDGASDGSSQGVYTHILWLVWARIGIGWGIGLRWGSRKGRVFLVQDVVDGL